LSTQHVTWDCHAHVIEDGDRYPLSPDRSYNPPAAPLQSYIELLDRRGLNRGVLVQPSVYGFDNSCLLDALDRADGRLLGVAVPAPDSTPGQLEAMHRRGVRGVRCNLLNPAGLDTATVIRWQPVLRELGWHVALHLATLGMSVLHAYLDRFDVPVVIDHMGRPKPGRVDPTSPLVDLVRAGACFVKLSAPYRLSDAAPPWHDVTPLARALLGANPAACLWATDWPHTDTRAVVREDDVFEALDDWCPEPGSKEILMTQGASTLFG
jgi:2-pyrone-4,6-dicarboxylate lactonase